MEVKTIHSYITNKQIRNHKRNQKLLDRNETKTPESKTCRIQQKQSSKKNDLNLVLHQMPTLMPIVNQLYIISNWKKWRKLNSKQEEGRR